jgi:hypothetical protein
MKQKFIQAVHEPTEREITMAQNLADGKEAMAMAVEQEVSVSKIYEGIAILKSKYGQATNASLVALFMRNKLIK